MNKLQYIFNNDGVVFFINSAPKKVLKTDKKYAQIVECFNLPDDEQFDAVVKVFKAREVQTTFVKEGFDVTPDRVTYKGQDLPTPLAIKIRSLHKEGLPLNLFEKFWENLEQNPSSSSVNELYDFLACKELPICDTGEFIAYKGVDNNYYSIHGNKDTKVMTGTVTHEGKIYNGVGEYVSVARNQVDDNRDEHCSFGLHCGQLSYAQDFGSRVMVVKVNPKDVVSVPSDSSFMKCRVCAYEVISEYTHEIEAPIVDGNGKEIITDVPNKERNEFIDKVNTYLINSKKKGNTEVTVRQIRNSFSPKYPSRESIIDSIQHLGYSWSEVNGSLVVTL
jgi:hypothetical protein